LGGRMGWAVGASYAYASKNLILRMWDGTGWRRGM